MLGTMPKKRSPLARKLKAIRLRLGISQREAAEKTGVALRTWISWENDHRRPSGLAAHLLTLTFPEDFRQP